MGNHEAYQGMLKRLEEKNDKPFFDGWYIAYADGKIVCLREDLEYVKSVRLLNCDDTIAYFKISKDEMLEV